MKSHIALLLLSLNTACGSLHYEDNKGNKVDITTTKEEENTKEEVISNQSSGGNKISFSVEPKGCVAQESKTFAIENKLLHFLTATCDRNLQVYGYSTDWEGNELSKHELLTECAAGINKFNTESNNNGFLLAYACKNETTIRARQITQEFTAGPETPILTLRWNPKTIAVSWNPDADRFLVISEGKGVLVNEYAQADDGLIRLQNETPTTYSVEVLNGQWLLLQSKGTFSVSCSVIDSLGIIVKDSPFTLHAEGTSVSDSPAFLAGSRAIQHSAYTKGARIGEVSSNCTTTTGPLFNTHSLDRLAGAASFDARHIISLVQKQDQLYVSKIRFVGVQESLFEIPVGSVQTSALVQVAQGKVIINIDRKVTILKNL